MSKLHDNNFARKIRIEVRWTEAEFQLLRDRQQQIRAPSLAEVIRTATLNSISCQSSVSQVTDNFKENKENSPCTPYKEKKENSTPPGNALARPHEDFDFYFSQITDDESLRDMVREFLNGELRKGVDLAQKSDLREHFWRWLPKYQAKREIDSRKIAALEVERKKPDYQIDEQMLMKRRREEKAAELQRQLDAQKAEAEDAGDARAAFFAKRLNYQKERRKDEIL